MADQTKLQKHMEELEAATSGGAHDAVTFSGKGLGFLRDLFKGSKKKDEDDYEDEGDEDDELAEDEEGENEDVSGKQRKNTRRAEKSAKSKASRNGGELEEEDDDPEDPGAEGPEMRIANHGERLAGQGAVRRAKKNVGFDERRFAKSMDTHEDTLDAAPVLSEIATAIRSLAKSQVAGASKVDAVMEQNVLLGRAVRELLKSNAALAADMELIKKQPVTSPSAGFVVLEKGATGAGGRRLSKSDISDGLTDLVNEGLVDSNSLKLLQRARTDQELRQFVDSLPANVRDRL